MEINWQNQRLDSIAEVIMGQSPPGITCNVTGNGLPLLNGPTEFGSFHPIPEQWTTEPKKRARTHDILFCVRGSTTGRMNWADQEYSIGRGIAAVRHKLGIKYQPFLRALVEFNLPELLAAATGSTFPNVSGDQLNSMVCYIPPKATQLSISELIGAIDDKIELNRQMNRMLEAMAQAIFKSWFVDFDPVTTKAAGRKPFGMDNATAQLFPSAFEETEIGVTPEGWKVERIGALLELAYGKALKESDRQVGSIPVYGSNGQVGWHNVKLVDGPGIIVGRKGNPGIVTWSSTDFFPIDTTFYVVPKHPKVNLYFLFYALKNHDLESLGADSAVPGLNRNIAYQNKQILPPEVILDAFAALMRPIYEKMELNELEIRSLTDMRDLLLPKLLSGEVRVKQAEKIVEKVV